MSEKNHENTNTSKQIWVKSRRIDISIEEKLLSILLVLKKHLKVLQLNKVFLVL